jgi:hypothetical protein
MAKSVDEIFQDALKLSENEREVLSLMLTNSARGNEENNGWASPEIEQAWMEEIERREQAYANGEVELIPVEEVFRDLRKITAE